MFRNTFSTSVMVSVFMIIALLLMLEVPGSTSTTTTIKSKMTTSTTVKSNNNTNKVGECSNDKDCTGSGWYCKVETKRCTCKLFYTQNGTTCQPIVCKHSDFACESDGKEKKEDIFGPLPTYRCDSKGQCKCRVPQVLSENGSVCKEPLWANIVGWSGLAVAFIAVLVCCYCVMFRLNKKQVSGSGSTKQSGSLGSS